MKYKSSQEYYQKHKLCPQCKSEKILKSCVGYIFSEDLDFADSNSEKIYPTQTATCRDCNWSGIIDNLLEAKIVFEIKVDNSIKQIILNDINSLFEYIDNFNSSDIHRDKINFIFNSLKKEVDKCLKFSKTYLKG